MDAVRYWCAVLALVSVPQAILYWLIVHPFVGVWRRIGKTPTYLMLAFMYGIGGYLLWRTRGSLLAIDYGTNPWLWAPAAAFYAIAMSMQLKIRKQLPFPVLAGSPELDADGKGGTLLVTGLYARVRHPRYLNVGLGMAAWALFTNYLAMYVLLPVLAFGLALIAWFEEKELAERFGDDYLAYRERVPMLIPRFHRIG